jgi:hypothetical protein
MAEHNQDSQLFQRGRSKYPTPNASNTSTNHAYSCIWNHAYLFIVDRFNFEYPGLTCGLCLAWHSFPDSSLDWTEAPVASTTGTPDQVHPDSFGKPSTWPLRSILYSLDGCLRGPPQTYRMFSGT